MGHAAHFEHLKENSLGFMISRLNEAKIPNAIGRLITKYKLGKYAATNMNEFMAERITKDIVKSLDSNDIYTGSVSDVQYSDIFSRKWNCRYICPQAYIDYFTQQVWMSDINGAERVAKQIEEYLAEIEKAENPQAVEFKPIVTTLKNVERPQEEAHIKQDSALGVLDAFFGRTMPTIDAIEKMHDIKITLKL